MSEPNLRELLETLDPSYKNSFDSVDPGWEPILKSFIQKCIDAGVQLKVQQIKEKFGELRFYYYITENPNNLDVEALVEEMTRASYNTCETCGIPGSIRRNLNWHRSLCDHHYQEFILAHPDKVWHGNAEDE